MHLAIKNIGKVSYADVEVDGVTVIAGENDTGKSTVGKALYGVFSSFHQPNEKLTRYRSESLENTLESFFFSSEFILMRSFDFSNDLAKLLIEKRNELVHEGLSGIQNLIVNYTEHAEGVDKQGSVADEEDFDRLSMRLLELLAIDDARIFEAVLSKTLVNEFNGQINNVYTDNEGSISLRIKDNEVTIAIVDNWVSSVKGMFDLRVIPICLDSPDVLDESGNRIWIGEENHYIDLTRMLRKSMYDNNPLEEIVTRDKIEKIESIISRAFNGKLVLGENSGSIRVSVPGQGAKLNAKNLSSGLKTFAIIKTLLLRGYLQEKGTIILDEPEIHLHPEWQLIFAEVIVALQQEFDMHILLTTHSPYFIDAIETYSAKYGITDKCKYYLSQNEGATSVINDVTQTTDMIYRQLAAPLQTLEDMSYD